jgi:antitoxin VapB
VEIIKLGQSRLISPVGKRRDDLFLTGPRASEDFMSERRQPAGEERDREFQRVPGLRVENWV